LNRVRFLPFLLLVLTVAAYGLGGCAMMRPPEIEEGTSMGGASSGEGGAATEEAKYTHDEVVDAITTVLTSRQFRFALKRTDVEKAEIETQWRDEEAFEGGGPGTYGGEDKYRSFVIVQFDFDRNRVNIERTAQQMDFYINDWRAVQPRRYHRDEDMQIQKVVMELLEETMAE
jgi:hypothetical protein